MAMRDMELTDKYLRKIINTLKQSAVKHRGDTRPGKRRFGLYRYLRDVYELYLDLRSRRAARTAARRIAKICKLSTQRKSHPIRILIEASAGPEDSRQKSRWTQALRYALGWQQPAKRLKWFFQVNGGIAGSARKYAVNKKAARQKNGGSQKNIIHREPGLGENSKTNQLAVRNQLFNNTMECRDGAETKLTCVAERNPFNVREGLASAVPKSDDSKHHRD
jgi:hypothetical protein